MSINEAVQEAIAKNLPSAVAVELQSYISLAEKNKEVLAQTKHRAETFEKENEKIKEENERLKKLELVKEELDRRERNMDLTLAKAETVEANKRSDKIFELVHALVRNPVHVRSMTGQVAQIVPGSNNNSSYPTSQPISETTYEETK